jgi:integrase
MNKKTIALTEEQYREIIETIRNGFMNHEPNNRVATALILEANLGIRVSDITELTLNKIVKDGNRYRLDLTEEKTNKKRVFTVPTELYQYIKQYCIDNEIKSNEKIISISERQVQRHLKEACDYLGYDGISTHSFRKYFATNIYLNNDYNIVLVQELLQHSSPSITQRYIGIGSKQLEAALNNNLNLL